MIIIAYISVQKYEKISVPFGWEKKYFFISLQKNKKYVMGSH